MTLASTPVHPAPAPTPTPRRRPTAVAIAALALVVGAGLLAAPSGAATSRGTDDAASPTMTRAAQRGHVVVGTKFDQPLFGLVDPATGQPAGFDVEIARYVVREVFGPKAARTIEFVETPSKVREQVLQSGAVDLVAATYTITPTRDTVVDFAGPYFTAGQDLLTRAGDRSIHGATDLAGKRVCTVTGSTSATNLANLAPQAVPVLLDTYSACVAQLDAGQVDAVTTDDVILLGYLAEDPEGLRLVGRPFTSEPYGIGIAEGDAVLHRKVDAALRKAVRTGAWARAWKRTVGVTEVAVPDPPDELRSR